MYELLCCKAKQLQNVEKSLKCIKIAVSFKKSVKWTSILFILFFSYQLCSLWEGGKEEVSCLTVVVISLSFSVSVDSYHFECLEKSVNSMSIFSDNLEAVRFHIWQINLK